MDGDIIYKLNRYGRRVCTFALLPDADVSDCDEEDTDGTESSDSGESNDSDISDSDEALIDEEQQPQTSSTSASRSSGSTLSFCHLRKPMKELSFVPEFKDDIVDLKDPLEYFSKYWSESLTRYVVNMTNLYAVENGSSFRIDADDLEMYLGILIRMGVAPLPRYDMYWSNDFRLPAIASHMARDKFKNINRFIHFADNDEIIRDRDDPKYDRLFKVRPLLHFIRGNCLKMFQEQRHSIDEQIVPFKGKTRLRQYVPNKPHKWGFKIISRNGTDGFTHDFFIYDGKSQEVADSCGYVSGDMVLKLCETLPSQKNHIVYFDNYFNFLELQVKLKALGIYSIGTIRPNRLRGCQIRSQSELAKAGRGSFDCWTEREHGIAVVRWMDNRCVQLSSTYVAVDPITTVQRFDRKQKKKVAVQCPAIVRHYNAHMGGVDKFDMLMALYRVGHKSKKWYRPIFLWCLHLSVVNGWIHYKRDCDVLQERPQLDLLSFATRVSQALILKDKSILQAQTRKRGRPRAESGEGNQSFTSDMEEPRLSKSARQITPQLSILRDGYGHYPEMLTANKRMRCKFCARLTQTRCLKCKVFLCIRPERNCFLSMHTQYS